VLLTAAASQAQDLQRWGLQGGSTLGQGSAIWAQASGGLDVNGVVAAQLGYAFAVERNFDLGIAVQGNIGLSNAIGGTIKARVRAVDRGAFQLGFEIPVSVDVYTKSSPALTMVGVEPSLLMSSFCGRHVEIFYGVGARFFALPGNFLAGPQARAGIALPFGFFEIFLSGRVSYLFDNAVPASLDGTAELGLVFHIGGQS
jgi:hypothetical protein